MKYEQHKVGRAICSFSFSYVEVNKKDNRDPNTVDWVDEEKNVSSEKKKRKLISEYEASQMAKPGEEWPDLLNRIKDK